MAPKVEIGVSLLEDGTEVDYGIDVCIRRGEAAGRRAWRGGKEGTEGMKAEDVEAPPAVGLRDVADLERARIGKTDNGSRMKSLPDG